MAEICSAQEVVKVLTEKKATLLNLTGIVDRDERQYLGGGSFGDVYKGIWKGNLPGSNHPDVVVKVLRWMGTADPKTLQKRLKVSSQVTFLPPSA